MGGRSPFPQQYRGSSTMTNSLEQFHKRHEPLWWVLLEVIAVLAVLLLASTIAGA